MKPATPCIACGHELPPGAKSCPHCGAEQPAPADAAAATDLESAAREPDSATQAAESPAPVKPAKRTRRAKTAKPVEPAIAVEEPPAEVAAAPEGDGADATESAKKPAKRARRPKPVAAVAAVEPVAPVVERVAAIEQVEAVEAAVEAVEPIKPVAPPEPAVVAESAAALALPPELEGVDPALLADMFDAIANFQATPAAKVEPPAAPAVAPEPPVATPIPDAPGDNAVIVEPAVTVAQPAEPEPAPPAAIAEPAETPRPKPASEPQVQPVQEPEPRPEPASSPSPTPEPRPDPESKPEPKPEPELKPAQAELEAEPKLEPESKPVPEPEPSSEPVAPSESTPESQSVPQPALASEAKPSPEPAPEPAPKPVPKPGPAAKARAGLLAFASALRSRKGLYVAGSVLVVALAGGGGYWAWSQKKIADEQAAQLQRQQEAELIRKAQEEQRRLDEEAAEKARLQAAQQAALDAEEQARQEAEAEEAARLAMAERIKNSRRSRERTGYASGHPIQPLARDSRHTPPMYGYGPGGAALSSGQALGIKPPEPPRREPEAPQQAPSWIAAAGQNPLTGASGEQLLALAAQCKSLGDCVNVMLAASEPYEREAVQAALLRLPSFNQARPVAGVDGSSPEALVYRASALIDQQQTDEAERLLGTALALEPSNPASWIAVADLLVVKGQRGAATHALILAYELWPNKMKARQFFERQAAGADRIELRPAYQAALRAVQMVRLRAK